MVETGKSKRKCVCSCTIDPFMYRCTDVPMYHVLNLRACARSCEALAEVVGSTYAVIISKGLWISEAVATALLHGPWYIGTWYMSKRKCVCSCLISFLLETASRAW